jgi:hypothetical protein
MRRYGDLPWPTLDDFQKIRADLNEEILGCGHLGVKRFFALDHQAMSPARWAPAPRNCSDS